MDQTKNLKNEFGFWVKGSWAPEFVGNFERYATPSARIGFALDNGNEYDANAIIVQADGWGIGHVSKGSCKSFRTWIASGYVPKARITKFNGNEDMVFVSGRWEKPSQGFFYQLGRLFG